jgi:hypothetical protein
MQIVGRKSLRTVTILAETDNATALLGYVGAANESDDEWRGFGEGVEIVLRSADEDIEEICDENPAVGDE